LIFLNFSGLFRSNLLVWFFHCLFQKSLHVLRIPDTNNDFHHLTQEKYTPAARFEASGYQQFQSFTSSVFPGSHPPWTQPTNVSCFPRPALSNSHQLMPRFPNDHFLDADWNEPLFAGRRSNSCSGTGMPCTGIVDNEISRLTSRGADPVVAASTPAPPPWAVSSLIGLLQLQVASAAAAAATSHPLLAPSDTVLRAGYQPWAACGPAPWPQWSKLTQPAWACTSPPLHSPPKNRPTMPFLAGPFSAPIPPRLPPLFAAAAVTPLLGAGDAGLPWLCAEHVRAGGRLQVLSDGRPGNCTGTGDARSNRL
jgi:hypothetical protein